MSPILLKRQLLISGLDWFAWATVFLDFSFLVGFSEATCMSLSESDHIPGNRIISVRVPLSLPFGLWRSFYMDLVECLESFSRFFSIFWSVWVSWADCLQFPNASGPINDLTKACVKTEFSCDLFQHPDRAKNLKGSRNRLKNLAGKWHHES